MRRANRINNTVVAAAMKPLTAMMTIEVVNNGDALGQEWPNRNGTGGTCFTPGEKRRPQPLSVHRRKVSGQGRPLVAGLLRRACRVKMVPAVPSRLYITLDIYRSIYRGCGEEE
jgi:hypothetical protein